MTTSTKLAKPTIVVVPGAWHPRSCFERFLHQLHEASYSAVVAALPSVDPVDASTADCASDARSIREQHILPAINERGEDILIVAFSYGGIPASGAATGLHKLTRASQGKCGGVVGLVLVSAFVIPEGKCLVQGKRAPMVRVDHPTIGVTSAADPIHYFYHDLEDSLAKSTADSLLPQSDLASNSPAPAPAWADPAFEGHCAYIRCLEDVALPIAVQDMFIGRMGKGTLVRDIRSSHSPFLSRPDELTQILGELATKCAESGPS